MFSNYSLTFALVGTASAISRDPLLTWKSTKSKTHDMDYFVPNFGVDKDIRQTEANLAASELRLKHRWNVTKEQLNPKPFKDYTVPNFGVDRDIRISQTDLAGAETTLGHKWVVKAKKDLPKPNPVDYFVPNFGQDKDITHSFTDLDWAEKARNHKWVVTKEDLKKEEFKDYRVPDFGLDKDILATRQHQAEAQKSLKTDKWNPEPYLNYDLQTKVWVNGDSDDNESGSDDEENVQLSASREPLLTWKPDDPKSHPVDYFVPNFGLDQGIKNSLSNTQLAEKITGHTWQYIDPKDRPKPHKVDYVVPNFGQDTEIQQTLALAAKAETKLKHKWTFVPKKLRPKDHKVDYFVPSFGADPDISETNESETQAATEVWSQRLSSQIGEDQAAAQISSDAAAYRADAEKAQREADAAAAKAAAFEADAQAARDVAVTNDFKDKMRADVAAAAAAEATRAQEWSSTNTATQSHYAATEAEKLRDASFYLNETRARTQASYDADRQSSEQILATAAAEKLANAQAKAQYEAAQAEKLRLADYVRQEGNDFMVQQRLAGMQEEATAANINLEQVRAKQIAAKAAQDASRAKFWEEYERLHGAQKQVQENVEAAKEAAVQKVEKVKELAEEAEAKESQKASEEAAAKTIQETAESDAAAKKVIADQQKAEEDQDEKAIVEEKEEKKIAKKEAIVRAKAVEELVVANKVLQEEKVAKIDQVRGEENQIKQMDVAAEKIEAEAEGIKKAEVVAKIEAKAIANISPPPELMKSIIKQSEEKSGIKVTESGEETASIAPKTAGVPIDAPKAAKKAAATTLPAELAGPKPPAATKVMFDDEDFHITI